MISNVLQSIQTEFQDNWGLTKIKFGDAGFNPRLENENEWIQVAVLPIGTKAIAYGTRVDESHGLYVTTYSRNQTTTSMLADHVSSFIQNRQVDGINIKTPQPKGQGTTVAQTGTTGKYYIRSMYPMQVLCAVDIFNVPVIIPAPTIDIIAGDDIVTWDEYKAGFFITGTGVDNDTIELMFNSGTIPIHGNTSIVSGGVWSIQIDSADVDSFGQGQELVSAIQVRGGDKSSIVTSTILIDVHNPVVPAVPITDLVAVGEESQITLTWTQTIGEVYDVYINGTIYHHDAQDPFYITTECEATYYVISNTTLSTEESNHVISKPIQEVLTISDLSATDGTIENRVKITFTEQTEPVCSI